MIRSKSSRLPSIGVSWPNFSTAAAGSACQAFQCSNIFCIHLASGNHLKDSGRIETKKYINISNKLSKQTNTLSVYDCFYKFWYTHDKQHVSVERREHLVLHPARLGKQTAKIGMAIPFNRKREMILFWYFVMLGLTGLNKITNKMKHAALLEDANHEWQIRRFSFFHVDHCFQATS